MRNYVQRGHSLTIPAPADVLSGGIVIVGELIGVANGDAKTGDSVDVDTVGVYVLPKVAALAIAIGDLVYWDSTNKLVTKTASGNKKLGYAVTAAANPSAVVNIRLVPTV
ncbi:DUF2190 family protein [Asticcacaulis tiandongensis]|uniref:DUF2190 family protein n=1 Tax=Asticcacaulis tiandongensis TaxID=2565365 RepID=UPI00112BF4AD|nr:DUF2190 family protein [Asticcacaulis tiandongensis]